MGESFAVGVEGDGGRRRVEDRQDRLKRRLLVRPPPKQRPQLVLRHLLLSVHLVFSNFNKQKINKNGFVCWLLCGLS